MKIAIKANPDRGKEIISLLESLGGINDRNLGGLGIIYFYYIDENNIIQYYDAPKDYKVYTLEEFEKEFPFKIGETVITTLNHVGTIIGIVNSKYKVLFKEDSALVAPRRLKLYKEMKEERNITLTLDKAKEWYKKGGELKEIALQAFNEAELNPLPRSWEEFAESTKFTFNGSLEYINGIGHWSNGCLPNKSIGESSKIWDKHLALFQLEQLRNYWIQNRTYKWDDHSFKYQIKFMSNHYEILALKCVRNFLTFPTREMAEDFLVCFRDLIEKAGDLI